ncbi:secreted protein [hydrocarbon metagenome]|uniref:Secreted protein n=1 Tax=hydrocarbon metagenome TaxID=938273 RepID=A0A0W8F0K0_9ZZZZ
MLFVFLKPGKQTFWMKDTLIPLDMIMLSPDLQIVGIKTNLTPQSEEIIISHEISAYVIEVNGGYCERNRIAIGDTVSLHLTKNPI